MNPVEAQRQLPHRERFDLMDFANLLLSEAGELEVANTFEHPIILELGKDVLELSNISFPQSAQEAGSDHGPAVAYILRNLSDGSGEGSLLFDDELKSPETMDQADKLGATRRLTIGRNTDATPELRLSLSVSREHMYLRLDNRNVHFADLYSMNSTRVFLHQDDLSRVGSPRRRFIHGEPSVPLAKIDNEWSR